MDSIKVLVTKVYSDKRVEKEWYHLFADVEEAKDFARMYTYDTEDCTSIASVLIAVEFMGKYALVPWSSFKEVI